MLIMNVEQRVLEVVYGLSLEFTNNIATFLPCTGPTALTTSVMVVLGDCYNILTKYLLTYW